MIMGADLAGDKELVAATDGYRESKAASWFVMYRTVFGLRLRAVGENPEAVDTVGIRVSWLRYAGVILSGVFCGLAAAVLFPSKWINGMPNGRGFIALACLVFGRWHPVGAVLAALLFGYADTFRIMFESRIPIPSQFVQMLPYVLAVVVLVGMVGRARAPAADGLLERVFRRANRAKVLPMKARTALLAAVLAAGLAAGLPADELAIEEIRALYREAKSFQGSEVVLPETWLQLWDEGQGGPAGWRRSTGRPDDASVVSRLDLYLERGAPSSAVLFQTSPSGDWALTTEYFFRDGGGTAFIFSELRTFPGPLIVERRYYYDREGREIRALRAVKDPAAERASAQRPGAYPDRLPGLHRSAQELLAGLGLAR